MESGKYYKVMEKYIRANWKFMFANTVFLHVKSRRIGYDSKYFIGRCSFIIQAIQ